MTTVVQSGSTVTLDFEPGTATAVVSVPGPAAPVAIAESTAPGTAVLEYEPAVEVVVSIPSHTISVEVAGPGPATPVTIEESP